MNKSLSDTDLDKVEMNTPPSYVFQRVKRSIEQVDETIVKQLEEFKEEIRRMFSLFSLKQEREIQSLTTTLKEIQQSNINIESSIAFLTAQNDDLKIKVGLLEDQAKQDSNYIKLLEDKIETIQIGTQKPNFVIKNVPRRKNESKDDLIDMVLCLSKDIDCTMTKHDIKDIYRVRGKHSEKLNTPIIVETSSTLLKTDFLKMGKTFNVKHKTKLCCKNLGFKSQENTPIFLSEHLTSKGSRLFFLARDLTKSGCYKFCWTAYGRVLVKKDESSPTITIRNEQQIQQLKMSK